MAESNSPVLASGEKTITAAGTAEQLVAASERVYAVTIIAKVGNGGNVYVGGSDIASSTNDGLPGGTPIEITSNVAFDLADIYIDVDTNGEGVDYYASKA